MERVSIFLSQHCDHMVYCSLCVPGLSKVGYRLLLLLLSCVFSWLMYILLDKGSIGQDDERKDAEFHDLPVYCLKTVVPNL